MSFVKTSEKNRVIYRIGTDLDEELAAQICQDIHAALLKNASFEAIILNLQDKTIDHRALKVLTPMGLELRKLGRTIYAVTQNKSAHTLIRTEGMDMLIKAVHHPDEIRSGSVKRDPPKLDVSFVNPFIEGVLYVLKIQCQCEAAPEKPALKMHIQNEIKTDIAGIIGINSQTFTGSIVIGFPASTFLHLMSKMLGEDYKEITDELKDGAAELLNMIFGQAKTSLNKNGHTIERALPTVARGADLKIDHTRTHDSIILPFKMGEFQFYMEIAIEKCDLVKTS